jgi:hypothetical protein
MPFKVAAYQCEFLRHGFIVRGACASGVWIKGRELTTGSIFAPLYRYESTVAIVPRILYGVDEDTDVLANDHFAALEQAMPYEGCGTGTDYDGRLFVDYLYAAMSAGDTNFFKRHASLIREGIGQNAMHSRRLKKYWWMGDYHNRVVRSPSFCESEVGKRMSYARRLSLLIGESAGETRIPPTPITNSYGPWFANWDYHPRAVAQHATKCSWCSKWSPLPNNQHLVM